MTLILIISFIVLLTITFSVLLGYYVGITEKDTPLHKTPSSIIHRNKPGGIFKEPDVPSGPVQRPTIAMINKWNEDPKKTAEKEAMKETFDADPALRKLKEEMLKTAQY